MDRPPCTKAHLLLQCLQKVVLDQMDHPVNQFNSDFTAARGNEHTFLESKVISWHSPISHTFSDWGLEVRVMAPPWLGICCNVWLQPRLEFQWSLYTHQRAKYRRARIATRGRTRTPRYGREFGHWLRFHVWVGYYRLPSVKLNGSVFTIQYHYRVHIHVTPIPRLSEIGLKKSDKW